MESKFCQDQNLAFLNVYKSVNRGSVSKLSELFGTSEWATNYCSATLITSETFSILACTYREMWSAISSSLHVPRGHITADADGVLMQALVGRCHANNMVPFLQHGPVRPQIPIISHPRHAVGLYIASPASTGKINAGLASHVDKISDCPSSIRLILIARLGLILEVLDCVVEGL